MHFTALHYSALHYRILRYTTLHYTTLFYTTLHYTTLHFTTLHYTTLHYTTLQTIKSFAIQTPCIHVTLGGSVYELCSKLASRSSHCTALPCTTLHCTENKGSSIDAPAMEIKPIKMEPKNRICPKYGCFCSK